MEGCDTVAITLRNGLGKQVGRGVAVAAVGASLFMGLVAAPAEAAGRQSEIDGPIRTTAAQARGDIPSTEAQCRNQGGTVKSSYVWSSAPNALYRFYHATTICEV